MRLGQLPTCAKFFSGRARTQAQQRDANAVFPSRLSWGNRHCGEACVPGTHGSRKLPGRGEGSGAFLEKGGPGLGSSVEGEDSEVKEKGHLRQEE